MLKVMELGSLEARASDKRCYWGRIPIGTRFTTYGHSICMRSGSVYSLLNSVLEHSRIQARKISSSHDLWYHFEKQSSHNPCQIPFVMPMKHLETQNTMQYALEIQKRTYAVGSLLMSPPLLSSQALLINCSLSGYKPLYAERIVPSLTPQTAPISFGDFGSPMAAEHM